MNEKGWMDSKKGLMKDLLMSKYVLYIIYILYISRVPQTHLII